jgi:NAD(P)-dependent dehydrogenase (short-subunit alcohol dehydrogenase family)
MKTFLSIGTGPGIGAATADRFAREGYQLVLAARNTEKLKQIADQFKEKGHPASIASVDAANSESIAQLVADTASRFGPIDTVHYNAAVIHPTSIDTLDPAGFQYDLSVNIGGAYAAVRAVLPAMATRAQGTILLTGGGFGLQPAPDYIAMSVGKAGLRALALGLFEDLKKRGIHIATVTLCANVEPGSEGVAAVADEFFKLCNQEKDAWTAETILKF